MRKRLVIVFHMLRKKAYQFNALSDKSSKVLEPRNRYPDWEIWVRMTIAWDF